MIKQINRSKIRKVKHDRVRKKISGTESCPRLCVFRSSKNIYAQIINDEKGETIVSVSSTEKALNDKLTYGGNKDAAKEVGKLIAEKAIEKGVKEVVFDRGGYIYHGRVKELAEGARKGGLKF